MNTPGIHIAADGALEIESLQDLSIWDKVALLPEKYQREFWKRCDYYHEKYPDIEQCDPELLAEVLRCEISCRRRATAGMVFRKLFFGVFDLFVFAVKMLIALVMGAFRLVMSFISH